MTELPWASAEALGRLTLPQLLCLGLEKPPGGPSRCSTFAEYQAAMERRGRENAAWSA